jgi:hypothetical protein
MKKLVLIAVAGMALFATPAHAKDRELVCEGPVMTGTATFQRVNGVVHKLRVEGLVGTNCPFTSIGRYGDVGKQILKQCSDTDLCRVTAIVGKVDGRSLVGIPGCCELWIKKVIRIDVPCGPRSQPAIEIDSKYGCEDEDNPLNSGKRP